MGPIWLGGGMPDRISEATRPWEWVANLRLNLDTALVRFVELVGSGGDVFDAWLDRRLGLITIAPIAMPDYEAFLRDGRAPELSLQLRFHLADGTVRDGAQTWRVAVEDVDDTPAESVSFASGGTVRAGEPGAVIGRFAVTDPDSLPGSFRFSLLPADEWMFEIVNGDTLKLRNGVIIAREDAPNRPIYIEVSDGTNSSAHVLQIQVETSIAGLPRGATLVSVGERSGPLYAVNSDTARVDLPAFQVTGLNGYGQVFELARTGGQPSLWFERKKHVDLLDGLLDADRTGNGIRIHLAYDAVLQRSPTTAEMTAANAALVAGATVSRLVDELVASPEFRGKPGSASPDAFFQQVYNEIAGWWDAGGVAWHAGQVRAGASPGFQTEQIIEWATGLDPIRVRADQGFWVPHLLADPMLAIHRIGTGEVSFSAYGDLATLNAHSGMIWQAAWAIANGPAFRMKFGGMDNATFVDTMYREVLGRPPQTWAEFSRFYTPLENKWMQRHDALFSFATQVDPSLPTANPAPGGHAVPNLLTQGVGELLEITFGAATPAAWNSADAQYALEGVLRQAAREVARTPEFRERYGHLSNSEFIDAIFVEAYNRPVDWAGFSRLFFPLEWGWMGRGDILYAAATDPRATAPFLRDPTFDLL